MSAALAACVIVVAASVGACGPVTPSPSRPSGSIDPPTTTPPPSGFPSAEPTPSRASLKLSLTLLPPEFLPSSSLRSFGSEIVWTTGPDSTADIWHTVPGEAPERLFENPRRDSFVTQVARNAAGYAFVETNDAVYGPGGWRVWYLPTGSEKPTEVDRGSSPAAGGPPGIDLDDRRLVWAGFDEPASGSYSFLRAADIGDLAHADTILKLAIDDGLLWTPVLDGNLIWYAVIHADFEQTGVGDEFHIESIDLGSPSRERRRFAGTANDFAPAVTSNTIMWKTVQPGYSALTWGDLHVQDRATGRVRDVEIDRADSPSIGDRFAAFEEITRKRLLLYDISDGELIDASDALPPGMTSVTSVTVAGKLLVCAVAAEQAPPQIAWALLPE
jgi:hypothetical protein